MNRRAGGGLAAGLTQILSVCAIAPPGTSTETAPWKTENEAPAVVTTAPSRTSTSTDAVFPSTETVTVAVPFTIPVIRPAATVTVEMSELDQTASRPVR